MFFKLSSLLSLPLFQGLQEYSNENTLYMTFHYFNKSLLHAYCVLIAVLGTQTTSVNTDKYPFSLGVYSLVSKLKLEFYSLGIRKIYSVIIVQIGSRSDPRLDLSWCWSLSHCKPSFEHFNLFFFLQTIYAHVYSASFIDTCFVILPFQTPQYGINVKK